MEPASWPWELSVVPCYGLEVWDGEWEGGDVCTHIVDSLHCTEQTNTILQTKHTPIKMK